jgi:hypothetical protein
LLRSALPIATSSMRRFFQLSAVVLTVCCVFSAPLSHAGTHSIGTASGNVITCPPGVSGTGGQCYRVTISGCPGTSPFFAGAKLNTSSGTVKGAVLLTTGLGGNDWYETSFSTPNECSGHCGLQAIRDLNAAGYHAIQTNFSDPNISSTEPAGWATDSINGSDGPLALACRYATFAHWAWASILHSSNAHPVCATGNSGGSAAIAYSLTHYALGSLSGPGPTFRMVELTSGPPLSRLDHGCLGSNAPKPNVSCPNTVPPTQISENIGKVNAEAFIDPAYDGDVDSCPDANHCAIGSTDICGNSIVTGGPPDSKLLDDSILSNIDPPSLSYTTNVNFVFADQDGSSAVPLGEEFYRAVTSTKTYKCVSGPKHNLPAYAAGEAQILNDITTKCK